MLTKKLLSFTCLVSVGLFVTACADEQVPGLDESASEQLSVVGSPAYFTLGEFEGSFNADTGELELGMVEVEASSLTGDEFRTNQQAYGFCNEFIVNVAGVGVGVNTFADTVFYTVAECIPADEVLSWDGLFYAAGGGFCFTVRVDNRQAFALANVHAEITEITSGYEGYQFQADYDPPCCGTGADLSGLTGQNVPSDAAGAFAHLPVGGTELATGEYADQQWTLRNAGGSFSLRGRIVGQVVEEANGADDDCDGIVDNATASFADGVACREDLDCSSGSCSNIVEETGFGTCGLSCPAGTFGATCDPCVVDCNGNGACDEGLSGTGDCICDAGWAGDFCDDCAPTNFGADCSGVCVTPCGPFGTCSSGTLGDGTCGCFAGGHGAACEFSCSDLTQNGDEE